VLQTTIRGSEYRARPLQIKWVYRLTRSKQIAVSICGKKILASRGRYTGLEKN